MFDKLRYYGRAFFNSFHLRLRLANLICGLLPDFFSGVIRARLYRLAGFRIGSGSFIMSNIRLLTGQGQIYQKLQIGSNTLISTNVTINLDGPVTIEDNVTLGPFVKIYTGSHHMGPSGQRCLRDVYASPVVVERGSWVALGATILPGVRIGYGSVVAGGAVVTKDVPPNSYVAGVPARVIKTLTELNDGAADSRADLVIAGNYNF